MRIDLINRCYYEKSKGNTVNFDRLRAWLAEGRLLEGSTFEVKGKRFEWKVLNAEELNDIIRDDYTDWVMIRALDDSFEALAKREEPEIDNAGLPKSVTFNTMWIFKSEIPKLEVSQQPINIWCPHIFTTAFHRINYDFRLLIESLHDPNVSLTRFVDYKEFKTDMIKIR